MNQVLVNKKLKYTGLIIGFVLLGIITSISLITGQVNTSFKTLFEVLTKYNPENTSHLILTTTRLSRTAIAIMIGSSLAIAGALMQAITRNPMASPSIFGINAGALFFVVFTTSFLAFNSLYQLMASAFIGGTIATILVFFLGSVGKNSLSPLKIVLAGAAITALFTSLTQGLLVIDEQSLESVLFWLGGSVTGRSIKMLLPVVPFMVIGSLTALLLSPSINLLAFGEDIAKSLGQKIILIKGLIGLIIVLLAGSSVAVGGSIGFIGLVVPHMVRGFVGIDYKWIIPYCAIYGSILLLLSDIIARVIIMPEEVPIGVMTAFIGVPFFIYIARKGNKI